MQAILAMLLPIVFSACSETSTPPELDADDQAWNQVSQFDVEANAKHVLKFPSCRHYQEAETRLWKECDRSEKACSAYVRAFPNSTRIAQIEETLWDICEHRFVSRCSSYAKAFPNGAHRAEAERKLWRGCEQYDGVCNDYIDAYPTGGLHRTQLENKLWKACESGDNEISCLNYLNLFPKGVHIAAVRPLADKLGKARTESWDADSALQDLLKKQMATTCDEIQAVCRSLDYQQSSDVDELKRKLEACARKLQNMGCPRPER